MSEPYDLGKLDANTFEHLVNFIALKVIGNGVTGFAPGSDGGRDGYFNGEAPYPSDAERWSGVWYIQSKFHKPHLTKNSQQWLIGEIGKEIKNFTAENSPRKTPDNLIIATNIEPSGVPQTGAFDKIKAEVEAAFGKKINVDIWGGRRILDFLSEYPSIAQHYGHFLTPGSVLSMLYSQMADANAQVKHIIEYLVLNQFNEQIYTKLEQAGSNSDSRPKIHELFIDLPYKVSSKKYGLILQDLVLTSANNHRASAWNEFDKSWSDWGKNIRRARTIILKGGPGQGKSTIGQFFSQVQRSALLLSADAPKTVAQTIQIAKEFKVFAESKGFWPLSPRIPVTIELKDYARWYGTPGIGPKGVLTYLADKISNKVEQVVLPGTLRRTFETNSWFINFDGLDEVPNDVKDKVAEEILRFTNETLPALDCDVLTLCSTRPQGYSGQFESLNGTTVELTNLIRKIALECASSVVKFGRSKEEAEAAIRTLSSAMESPQVRELMTTPLQSHIMAVVVRDGGRPPEKRWQLFENFYQVMKKRESLKDFPDPKISKLLRENDQLLKSIHTRLGISLHARAEISEGAEANLDRGEFRILAAQATSTLMDENVDSMVESLMEATTERLVFVNTPDNSDSVRFDIRQLQEFFAAEFIYSGISADELSSRLDLICSDAHWREVMHFVLSALIVNNRTTELAVAIEVLSKINEGSDCYSQRLFNKRMALGSILALRLLSEGVLEQDKRVRQKFSAVIKPLFSSFEIQILASFSKITHPNSLGWVINCMIDCILENCETESIGAATILALLLKEDNPRTKEVAERIFSHSPGYIERVLSSIDFLVDYAFERSESDEPVEYVQSWVINKIILLVVRPNKKQCSVPLVSALEVLRSNPVITAQEIQRIGLSETEFSILDLFLDDNKNSPSGEVELDHSYGGIVLEYNKYNWRNPDLPSYFQFEVEHYNALSPLMTIGHKIHKYAHNRSKENFLDLLQTLELFGEFSEFAPRYLVGHVPVNLFSSSISQELENFKDITDADYGHYLCTGEYKGKIYKPFAQELHLTGELTAEGNTNLLRDHPTISGNLWIQDFRGTLSGKTAEFNKSGLLGVLLDHPDLLVANILSFGVVLNKFPEHEAQLREALNSASQTTTTGFSYREIAPFKINPISEKPILKALSYGFCRLIQANNNGSKSPLDEDVLASYGISPQDLEAIFANNCELEDYRASALSLYLLFPAKIVSIETFFERKLDKLFFELSEKKSYGDLLEATVDMFNKEASAFSEASKEFWGKVIHFYRNDYEVTERLHRLILNLRERSHAPLHESTTLEKWLSYDAL